MTDPTLITALTATLENLCNQALAYDPGSRQRLSKLAGKVLAIESTAPSFNLYISTTEDGTLALMSHYEGSISTRLRGKLTDLMALAANSDSSSLSQYKVEVIGSSNLLIELQAVLKTLDIDWEDALNQYLGDTLGHPLAEGLRLASGFFKARKHSIERLSSEYIQEELKLVPSKAELSDFYQQVDELRLSSDRAEARLRQLQQRVQQSQPIHTHQSASASDQ